MSWIRDLFMCVYEALFACRHGRQTRPFTLAGQTYKVCTDCGKQIFYSVDRMEPLTRAEMRRLQARLPLANPVKVMPATAMARQAMKHRAHKPTAA
jgi:hypothetical protein